MLKLTQNRGKAPMIGEDVQVYFFGYNGYEVKFGFSASKSISGYGFSFVKKKNPQISSQEDR